MYIDQYQMQLSLNGISFVVDGNGIPYFEYDENWFYALKNNPDLISNIFDWINEGSPDGYGLVEDYFHFCRLGEAGAKYDEESLAYNSPPDKQENIDYRNVWEGYLKNPYIKQEQKIIIQNFLINPKWFPKEPKPIKPPVPGHIYLIECQGLYKIGKEKNKTSRTNHFKTIMPVEIKNIHSFYSKDYHKAETLLHKKFSHLRQKGEWFNLSPEDVEYICSISDHRLP